MIIKKANALWPDSLAMIGMYGSVVTGDEYEKSDLDLLDSKIVYCNEELRQLRLPFDLETRILAIIQAKQCKRYRKS